jgi:hypothetical protein
MRYYFASVKVTIIKTVKLASAGEDGEHHCTSLIRVDLYSYHAKQYRGPSKKLKENLSYNFVIPLLINLQRK